MSSINLLPQSIKENRELSKKNSSLLTGMVIFIATALFVYASLGTFWYVLIKNNSDLRGQIALKQAQTKSFSDIESKAQQLSGQLNAINRVMALQPHWQKVLEEISYDRPPNVAALKVGLDVRKDYVISLDLLAPSIYSLSVYRNALATKSGLFTGVDFGTVSRDDSGNFRTTLTMSLAKDALK